MAASRWRAESHHRGRAIFCSARQRPFSTAGADSHYSREAYVIENYTTIDPISKMTAPGRDRVRPHPHSVRSGRAEIQPLRFRYDSATTVDLHSDCAHSRAGWQPSIAGPDAVKKRRQRSLATLPRTETTKKKASQPPRTEPWRRDRVSDCQPRHPPPGARPILDAAHFSRRSDRARGKS